MEFRILGPLEARDGDSALLIPGAKPAAVLAVLLLSANRAVSVERLSEAIWPHLPHSPASNLRTHVARLRSAFPEERIITDPGGYRVVVDRDELDLTRFEELTRSGGRALDAGDPRGAMAVLRRALDLWRGDPLEGLRGGPLLEAEIARLREIRTMAIEGWADAALGAGEPEEAAAELSREIRISPLREQLWERLMLSLYACGRQGEALTAYQDAYRLLDEELGVPPGEALQSLHRRILDGAPVFDGPRQASLRRDNARRPQRPRDLPRDLPSFVGRQAELASIKASLRATAEWAPVVTIHGPGGVGKSALALRSAHQVAAAFPDGQIYIDLQGSSHGREALTPLAALTRILRELGVPPGEGPADVAEAGAQYRSALVGRKVLIVLDNATDEAHVLPLLPAATGCAAIITSRQMLAGIDSAPLGLGLLPEEESLGLLGSITSRERISGEPEAAARVVRQCGGLPLALRIAGARLASRPSWRVETLAQRLQDEASRLDELRYGHLDVRSCFMMTYRELAQSPSVRDRRAARAFRLLGVLNVPEMSVGIMSALLDQTDRATREALDRLVDVRLLDETAADRFRVHDLLRLCAVERCDEFESRSAVEEASRRVAGYAVGMATQAARFLRPGAYEDIESDPASGRPKAVRAISDSEGAVAWFESEAENLLALARHFAGDKGTAASAIKLTRVLQDYWPRCGRWLELEQLGHLAHAAAVLVEDRKGEANALLVLALVDQWAGRFRQAERRIQECLTICRELRFPWGEAATMAHFAHLYLTEGDTAKAVTYSEEGLRRFRELGLRLQEAEVLNNLGEIHLKAGRHDEAVVHLRQARELRETISDHMGAAHTLALLGLAACLGGDHLEAVEHFDRAVDLSRRTGHRLAEWQALLGRAEARLRLGASDHLAIRDAELACEVATQARDPYQQELARLQLHRARQAAGVLPPGGAAPLLASRRHDPLRAIWQQVMARVLGVEYPA
ncbi:BTAD domain-containing putative transcriptional regulator [[Actinomadura] parvosata]|uniref:BTAD domain-containing putative transcriptional regulator n=1 Tax=[Actinomadura] parvosata TaxID=1955412 RepID=UPI00406CE946